MGVTPDMVTDNMISCGNIEATAGLACAIASETDFKGIKRRTCKNTIKGEHYEKFNNCKNQ